MSRETLKSFFNALGGPTAGQDSIGFTYNTTDQIDFDGSEDLGKDSVSGLELLDLGNDTTGLLGDYLSFLTQESNNLYKLKRGNEEAALSDRGEDLVLAENQGAQDVYVKQGTELFNNFNTVYSNSQFNDLKQLVDKIGSENLPSLGHELLSSIEGTGTDESSSGSPTASNSGDPHNVTQAVQNDVLQNSRFGNIPSKKVFIERFEDTASHESNKKLKVNRAFGSYNDSDTAVRIEQLKSLGASLLMKVSGFDRHDAPGTSQHPDELGESFATSDVVGGIIHSQRHDAGKPSIASRLYRARDAYGFPVHPENTDNSVREGRGVFLPEDKPELASFGTTYNTEFYFHGKNHKMHKLQAALSIKLLSAVGKEMYDQVISHLSMTGFSKSAEEAIESEIFPNDNLLGMARGFHNLYLQAIRERVLTPTIYPYIDALERGLKVLFDDDLGLSGILRNAPVDPEDDRVKKIKKSLGISTAPGFWLAVSRSALKSSSAALENLDLLTQTSTDEDNPTEAITNFMSIISENNVLRYMNAIATVGDASLQAFAGKSISPENFRNRPRNVDALPDGPGTRVGKSRKDNGYRENQLAWSQNDVPSAYLLPLNPIRAAGRLDKIISGPNPFGAMIGSELVDQTYFSKNMDGSNNRIPKEVVKALENRLEAEYVPFYFQDLRTNEVISFHAFLDNLQDSITPNYNSYSGYGRLDPVQIYEGTKRQLSIGFTVLATSKQDFNAMWYKINKLVTLLYPQWTKGTMVGHDLGANVVSKFIQPHSQVLGASPLVRIRVGDIIKSNYSRFNLARMFGIGDGDVAPMVDSGSKTLNKVNEFVNGGMNIIKDASVSLLALVYGSPMQYFNTTAAKDAASSKAIVSKTAAVLADTATNYLKNGFVNPITLGVMLNRLRDPNVRRDNPTVNQFGAAADFIENVADRMLSEGTSGPAITPAWMGLTVYLKSNTINGYTITGGPDKSMEGKKIFLPRPVKVMITKKHTISYTENTAGLADPNDPQLNKVRIIYTAKIVDFSIPTDAFDLEVRCNTTDIYQMPNDTVTSTIAFGLLLAGAGGIVSPVADALINNNGIRGRLNSSGLAAGADLVRYLYASQESHFMEPFNNPFVKAYESTQGRGLAGVMNGITFDWLSDFNWEVDFNSRAPMGCKISFNFDVIHDLPPGLDHSGYNRAPLYNVGDIMRDISGDVYESFTKENEFKYRKEANKGVRIKGKK